MPQMKPMNWLILFTLTNFMLMFLNMIIYFNKNNLMKKYKKPTLNNNNWKW